jgi:hypothetical protein
MLLEVPTLPPASPHPPVAPFFCDCVDLPHALRSAQLGVCQRPYIVVEACNALRPTQSLRGTTEQYQARASSTIALHLH